MSALHCLVTGELWRDPVQRQGKTSGKPFVSAMLKSGTPTEAIWVKVVAFDATAQSELMRLTSGDAISVQGSARLTVFEKGGEHHAGLDITAAHVLAMRQPKPTRKAPERRQPKQTALALADDRRAPPTAPAFDDDLPF